MSAIVQRTAAAPSRHSLGEGGKKRSFFVKQKRNLLTLAAFACTVLVTSNVEAVKFKTDPPFGSIEFQSYKHRNACQDGTIMHSFYENNPLKWIWEKKVDGIWVKQEDLTLDLTDEETQKWVTQKTEQRIKEAQTETQEAQTETQKALVKLNAAEGVIREERTRAVQLKGFSETETVQWLREKSDARHQKARKGGPENRPCHTSFAQLDAQPTELQAEYRQQLEELESHLAADIAELKRGTEHGAELEGYPARQTPLKARIAQFQATTAKLETAVRAEFLAMQAQADAQKGLFGTDAAKDKKDAHRKPRDVVAPLDHDMAGVRDGFGFRTFATKPTSEQLALLYPGRQNADTLFRETPKFDKLPADATEYEGKRIFRVKTDKVDALGRTMYDVYDLDHTGDAPKFVKRDALPTEVVDTIKVGKDKFAVVFDSASQKFELEAFEAATTTEAQQRPRKHQKYPTFAVMPTDKDLKELEYRQLIRVANGKTNKYGALLYDTYKVEEAGDDADGSSAPARKLVKVKPQESNLKTFTTREEALESADSLKRIKIGDEFFVVVNVDASGEGAASSFGSPSSMPVKKLVPHKQWIAELDAESNTQLSFKTHRADLDKDGSADEGSGEEASKKRMPTLEEIAERNADVISALTKKAEKEIFRLRTEAEEIVFHRPQFAKNLIATAQQLERKLNHPKLFLHGLRITVDGKRYVVARRVTAKKSNNFEAKEIDIPKFDAQPTKEQLEELLNTSDVNTQPVFEVGGKVFEVPARKVRQYPNPADHIGKLVWELPTSLDGTLDTATEVSVAELPQEPTADELAKMESESFFKVGDQIFIVPSSEGFDAPKFTLDKIPTDKELATMRPGTTFRVGDKVYSVSFTREMEIVPAEEFDLQIAKANTPEANTSDEVKKALTEYQAAFDAELARLKAAYEAEKTKNVAGETPEQKADRIHKACEAVRKLDVDFERKPISEHQESAPTPAPARWYHNTGKRVGAVNVTILLAATILQNMLEGFVGETSEDERTKKQKVADMFKAIVSGSKHGANFMAAWHILKPEASASDEAPKGLWGRYKDTLAEKPVFITGLSGLMLYDLFELARFSQPKAKALVMKLGLVKKA